MDAAHEPIVDLCGSPASGMGKEMSSADTHDNECKKKHPVPFVLGHIWTYFIPPLGLLSASDPCTPSGEKKKSVSLMYFVRTWVPPRGTRSIETRSLGRSCVEAEPGLAIVLGAGIHEQRQHRGLAELPSWVMQAPDKAPSISTN